MIGWSFSAGYHNHKYQHTKRLVELLREGNTPQWTAHVAPFDYQPPTYEEANKLTERRNSRFDGYIKDNGPRFFKPKPGDNFIRILPNTWEGSKHYAYPNKIHRGIGPDNQTYLCLKENDLHQRKTARFVKNDTVGNSRKKTPTCCEHKPLHWCIWSTDPMKTRTGIWAMSNKSDTGNHRTEFEKRQQRYLAIAHPIDGYDVEFVRDGEGINTAISRL